MKDYKILGLSKSNKSIKKSPWGGDEPDVRTISKTFSSVFDKQRTHALYVKKRVRLLDVFPGHSTDILDGFPNASSKMAKELHLHPILNFIN